MGEHLDELAKDFPASGTIQRQKRQIEGLEVENVTLREQITLLEHLNRRLLQDRAEAGE